MSSRLGGEKKVSCLWFPACDCCGVGQRSFQWSNTLAYSISVLISQHRFHNVKRTKQTNKRGKRALFVRNKSAKLKTLKVQFCTEGKTPNPSPPLWMSVPFFLFCWLKVDFCSCHVFVNQSCQIQTRWGFCFSTPDGFCCYGYYWWFSLLSNRIFYFKRPSLWISSWQSAALQRNFKMPRESL